MNKIENEDYIHENNNDYTFNDGLEIEKIHQPEFDDRYKSLGWKYDRSVNCKEFDLNLYIPFNEKIHECKTEEKYRLSNYDDFLIELIQDVASENMGWFYTTKADFINYFVKGENLYRVKWKKFKIWLGQNYKAIQIFPKASSKGWGLTISITIPWDQIPKELYDLYKKP